MTAPIGMVELERVASLGWQGTNTQVLGEWLLRAGSGFTGRANSVLPLGSPGCPLDDALNAVWEFYRGHHLTPLFQVPLAAVEVMKSIVSDTETTHVDLANELDHHIYHRFNVAQGLEDVQLFEHEKIEAIEIDTNNYLAQHTKQVTDCVKLMAQLPIKPSLLVPGTDDAALIERLKALKM